jgi:hypothetical protein
MWRWKEKNGCGSGPCFDGCGYGGFLAVLNGGWLIGLAEIDLPGCEAGVLSLAVIPRLFVFRGLLKTLERLFE